MNPGIVKKVQRHLSLEWVDESARLVIEDQIEEAFAYLKRYDPRFDLTDPQQLGLLITLVRYIRAGSTDDFEINYAKELYALSDLGSGDGADE